MDCLQDDDEDDNETVTATVMTTMTAVIAAKYYSIISFDVTVSKNKIKIFRPE